MVGSDGRSLGAYGIYGAYGADRRGIGIYGIKVAKTMVSNGRT
jgi:hypothetical protein